MIANRNHSGSSGPTDKNRMYTPPENASINKLTRMIAAKTTGRCRSNARRISAGPR
jgi:hypothetical protein